MNNSVIIQKDNYEKLVIEASKNFNLQEEIAKVRLKCTELFGDNGSPEMDPTKFESICKDAGAKNVFPFFIMHYVLDNLLKIGLP